MEARSGMQSHCQVQFHFNFRLGDDKGERACITPTTANSKISIVFHSSFISASFFFSLYYHFILFSGMKNDEQT